MLTSDECRGISLILSLDRSRHPVRGQVTRPDSRRVVCHSLRHGQHRQVCSVMCLLGAVLCLHQSGCVLTCLNVMNNNSHTPGIALSPLHCMESRWLCRSGSLFLAHATTPGLPHSTPDSISQSLNVLQLYPPRSCAPCSAVHMTSNLRCRCIITDKRQ